MKELGNIRRKIALLIFVLVLLPIITDYHIVTLRFCANPYLNRSHLSVSPLLSPFIHKKGSTSSWFVICFFFLILAINGSHNNSPKASFVCSDTLYITHPYVNSSSMNTFPSAWCTWQTSLHMYPDLQCQPVEQIKNPWDSFCVHTHPSCVQSNAPCSSLIDGLNLAHVNALTGVDAETEDAGVDALHLLLLLAVVPTHALPVSHLGLLVRGGGRGRGHRGGSRQVVAAGQARFVSKPCGFLQSVQNTKREEKQTLHFMSHLQKKKGTLTKVRQGKIRL